MVGRGESGDVFPRCERRLLPSVQFPRRRCVSAPVTVSSIFATRRVQSTGCPSKFIIACQSTESGSLCRCTSTVLTVLFALDNGNSH